jgi:hypothetical protein
MSSSIITSDDLRMEKSPLSLSPYQKFMYALNSKESKRQYPKRLQRFLDFINIFSPQKTEIKQGDEILIVNNVTQPQTFTNGNGTGNQMDGKIFSVEIAPDSFAEYLASNISPGNYTFYSENDPNLKGELVVSP